MSIRKFSSLLAAFLTLALAARPLAAASKPATRSKPASATPSSGKSAAAAASVSLATLLDNFEAVDWTPLKADGTDLSLERVAGKEGSALKLKYDLKDTKQWVQISKPMKVATVQGKAIEFWMKSAGKSNVLEIKLVDTDGTNYGIKRPAFTSTGDWTRIVIDETEFTYWWGGDKTLGPLQEIYVAVSAGDGGAGEVFLDELRLIPSQGGVLPKDGVIADCETTDGWAPSQGQGATITLGTQAGQKGKALAVQYSIPANQWVSIRKSVKLSLSPTAAFVFLIKGEGDPTNVEFKVVDRDDSTFGKVLEGQGADAVWKEIRLPLSELQYLWGGDNQLDTAHVVYIDVAVSGPAGKGKIFLDDLKVVP